MKFKFLFFLMSFCLVYIIILWQEDRKDANLATKNSPESIYQNKEIIANLDEMKVHLVNNGKILDSFDIVSVGKPGSFYETPTGEYKIENKEKSHFSNLGKVHMPFSMQFFGNFFIHGIPYHTDGTRVSSFYSGGCIRMQDQDAEKIYNFAEIGKYSSTTLKVLREQKYIANDYDEKLLAKDTNINIMTALISLEFIDQSKNLKNYGNIKDALSVMLKSNDNNIATAIANYYGEKEFLKKMNQKAVAIGLQNTKYNSMKYDDVETKTTREDNLKLIKYIENNKSYIYNILGGK